MKSTVRLSTSLTTRSFLRSHSHTIGLPMLLQLVTTPTVTTLIAIAALLRSSTELLHRWLFTTTWDRQTGLCAHLKSQQFSRCSLTGSLVKYQTTSRRSIMQVLSAMVHSQSTLILTAQAHSLMRLLLDTGARILHRAQVLFTHLMLTGCLAPWLSLTTATTVADSSTATL